MGLKIVNSLKKNVMQDDYKIVAGLMIVCVSLCACVWLSLRTVLRADVT